MRLAYLKHLISGDEPVTAAKSSTGDREARETVAELCGICDGVSTAGSMLTTSVMLVSSCRGPWRTGPARRRRACGEPSGGLVVRHCARCGDAIREILQFLAQVGEVAVA